MSNLTFALYVVPVAATVLLCGAALLFIRFLPRPEAVPVPSAPSIRPDAAVRAELARGLVSTLTHAKHEGALQRRDALLQELRDLNDGDRSEAAAPAQSAPAGNRVVEFAG